MAVKSYDFTFYSLAGEDQYAEGCFKFYLADNQISRIKESHDIRHFDGINEDSQIADIYIAMLKHISKIGYGSFNHLKETGIQIPIPPKMKEEWS